MIHSLRALIQRVLGAFNRKRRDEELAEELESHIAFAAEDFTRQGSDTVEARRQALVRFGPMQAIKEEYRDQRGLPWLDTTSRNLRYAIRGMQRRPGFATPVIATLAVAIGVNASVFSLVDEVWLKALPVREPERLVSLNPLTRTGERRNASYPLFTYVRDNESSLDGVYATLDGLYRIPVSIGAQSANVARVQLVSGEYFPVLGVAPFAGRLLTSDDNKVAGGHAVAVVSHAFWKARFNSSASAIGSPIRIDNHLFTIVGIAPSNFFGDAVGRTIDVWVPLMMQPAVRGPESQLESRNVGWLRIMARTKNGATLQAVQHSLEATMTSIKSTTRFEVLDGRRGLPEFRERFSGPLRILGGITLIMLLVVCSNLATLMLTRAESRRREYSIRIAIGAGRADLYRQLITEGIILGTIGCVLGVMFAWWGSGRLLSMLSTGGAAVDVDVRPDAHLLWFAVLTTVLAVILSVLVPAALALRKKTIASPYERLRPRVSRIVPALVVVQVILSLAVIDGGVLLLKTLGNLRNFNLGFAHNQIVQLEIDPGAEQSQWPESQSLLRDRLSRLPGVEAVTTSHNGFATGLSTTCCIIVDRHAQIEGEDREVVTLGVAPSYFQAMSIPLVKGRDFLPSESTRDPQNFPPVAIVNEEFARRFAGGNEIIGRRLGWGNEKETTPVYSFEIAGVVRNVTYDDARQRMQPIVYFPSTAGTLLSIRVNNANASTVQALRREVGAFDKSLEVRTLATVTAEVERMFVRERMLATLSSAIGISSVLLAAMGLFGLATQRVVARTREIGVRMALGASQAEVRQRETLAAMKLTMVGIVLGVPLTLAAGVTIRAQVFGVSTNSLSVLLVSVAVIVAVAFVASIVPAFRASRVDPLIALHSE